MKKQQIIPSPLTINVQYPQPFCKLINNKHYQQERMFVGYGNPSAQLLIVGQEVTWNKDEQAAELEHYCLQNMEHWAKNIQQGNTITVKSQVLYPTDDIHSEAYENFNPLFPHYFNYNKLDNREHITKVDGKFTHQNLEYGANATWFKYQKLIQYLYPNRQKNEYVDFFHEAFITELSGESRRHNIVVDKNLTLEKQKEQAKKQAEATKKSIEERCHLLKEPFFQDFPVKIFACGGYSDKIFPYLYGFDKEHFKQNGWFSSYQQGGKLYVCTWQFSAPLISDKMLQKLAHFIRDHILLTANTHLSSLPRD